MKTKFHLSIMALIALTAVASSCSRTDDVSSNSEEDSVSSSVVSSDVTSGSSSETSETSSDSSSEAVDDSSEGSLNDSSSESSSESSVTGSEESSEQSSSSSEETSESSSDESSESSEETISSSEAVDEFDYDPVYYPSVNPNLYGSSFLSALRADVKKLYKTTASYSALRTILDKSDANPDTNYTSWVPFYHAPGEADSTASWDSGATWNREHVWPNSRGAGETGAGSDPHVIRPTLTKDNSSRGNSFYGNTSSNEYDPFSCAGYEDARGEAARIIMYCVVRWGDTQGLSLSNNPNDSTSARTMGTLKTLLEWNQTYDVTKIEKSRQAYLDVGDGDDARNSTSDYGRNPFIDHPEYANYIWDENGLRTTPYGGNSGSVDSSSEESAEATWDYKQVTTLSGLDGKKVAIVSPSSTTGGSYYSLNDTPSNSARPWYLGSDSVTVEEGKMNGAQDLFTVDLQSDGTYTFIGPDGSYLNNYIDGTHYSICMGTPSSYDYVSSSWTVTMDSAGECVFQGDYSYLGFASSYGTWSGSKSAPSLPILLFEAA